MDAQTEGRLLSLLGIGLGAAPIGWPHMGHNLEIGFRALASVCFIVAGVLLLRGVRWKWRMIWPQILMLVSFVAFLIGLTAYLEANVPVSAPLPIKVAKAPIKAAQLQADESSAPNPSAPGHVKHDKPKEAATPDRPIDVRGGIFIGGNNSGNPTVNNFAPQARHILGTALCDKIIDELKALGPHEIRVDVLGWPQSEAGEYRNEWSAVFKAAGWKVNLVNLVDTVIPAEMTFMVPFDNGHPAPSEIADKTGDMLKRYFPALNLSADKSGHIVKPGEFSLIIGPIR